MRSVVVGMGAGLLIAGVSYGATAAPLLGAVPAIVWSLVVLAGTGQYLSLAVLASGGSAPLAVFSGLFVNARFVPVGLSVARRVRGPWSIGSAHLLGDYSLLANPMEPAQVRRHAYDVLGIAAWATWTGGTALGALVPALPRYAEALGLDVVLPAIVVCTALGELRALKQARPWQVALPSVAAAVVTCMSIGPAWAALVGGAVGAVALPSLRSPR